MMIRSILNIPESKLQELELSVKLTAYERKLLKELCEILCAFEEATQLIQQQNCVGGSLPIPVTEELHHILQALSSTYSKKLVTTRREPLAKRMTQYQENQNLKLTTALDPRFKIQWCGSVSEQVNIESLLAATAQHVNVTDDIDTSPPSKQTRTGFFIILSGTPRKRHTSQRGTKFPQYLNEPAIDMNSDPLMFWKNSEAEYPHLAELANKYLAI